MVIISIYFFLGLFFYNLFSALAEIDLTSIREKINITGNFQNSGIFSSYLVINIPLLYYATFFEGDFAVKRDSLGFLIAYRNAVNIFKRILFVLVLTLILLIVFKSVSRTSIFILVVLFLSYIRVHFGNRFLKVISLYPYYLLIAVILFSAGAVISALYLFHLKEMSAYGRIMKIDIALAHLSDHFWFGTGLGRFTWYYPQWQAQYFASVVHTPKEYFLSAGESFILFNEYVQLFMTVGFFGFCLFVAVLWVIFRVRTEKYCQLLVAVRVTIVLILAWGLFSYPFHVNFILFILFFCFGSIIVLYKRYAKITGYWAGSNLKWIVICPSLVLAVLSVYISFGKWHAVENLNSLESRYGFLYVRNESDFVQIRNVYKNEMVVLGSDGKVLSNYGKLLLSHKAGYPESVEVLERAKRYFACRETYELLSEAYKKAGDYDKAIENELWICNFLPNLFAPKLGLMKLYALKGDTLNARKVGREIISMPVKIPSYKVDKIKNEAQDMLIAL